MTQQTLDLAQAFRDAAEANKRLESASRAAAQANARARDLLEFCIEAGIVIKVVTPNDN